MRIGNDHRLNRSLNDMSSYAFPLIISKDVEILNFQAHSVCLRRIVELMR